MKKLVQAIALMLLTSSACYAQTQKDFIRNYKAPDFKLRTLDFSLNGGNNGSLSKNQFDTLGVLAVGGGTNLRYFKISNSAKYQGTTRSSIMLNGIANKVDEIGTKSVDLSADFSYDARFFVKPKMFIRAATNLSFNGSHASSSLDMVNDQTSMSFAGNLQTGIGYGRIEYTNFARKAMDIEFLLNMGNRLNSELSISELTTIADNLARVNYKRGFDTRLLQIWRLEQMDSIIGGLDIVTKRDMRYMAFLNDAMLFGPSFNRLSGSTIEGGVGHAFNGTQINSPTIGANMDHLSRAYVQYSHYIPTSYAFQHNIFAGYSIQTELAANDARIFRGRLFGRYEFGWYPNTRTALVASANLSSLDNEMENDSGSLRFGLDYYYYITPRTRLSVVSSIGGDITEDDVYFNGSSSSGLNYSVGFNFTHAIF
ncbi:MAG: hypothetical protein ABJG68_12685 [Crocinitomicaceae bacterium]